MSGRQRAGLLAAAAGAALLLAASPVVVHWMLTRPYTGLTLEVADDGAVRVRAVDAASSGAVAGLRPGDRILQVGSIAPASDAGSAAGRVLELDVINGFRAGDAVVWRVRRDTSVVERRAVLAGYPGNLVVTHLAVYAVAWAVALFLLWTRRDERAVRHLAYTILALTAGNLLRPITDMQLRGALAFGLQETCALGRFLGPATVVHLGVLFPRETLSARWRRAVLLAGYGIPLLLFVVEQAVLVQGFRSESMPYLLYTGVLERLHWWDIRFWVFLAGFGACGALLLRTMRQLETKKQRDQVKWLLWGTLFVVVVDAALVGTALYAGGRYSDFVLGPYRNLLYLVTPAALLVAVFRHDLFNVDRVVRNSALYFMSVCTVFVVFTVTENTVSDLLARTLPDRAGFVGSAVGGVVAAGLFVPLRRWFDRALAAVAPRPAHQDRQR